jgi:hypothetical protein
MGVDGLGGLRDSKRENPPFMPHLAHRGIVYPEVARHGMDGQAMHPLEPLEAARMTCRTKVRNVEVGTLSA